MSTQQIENPKEETAPKPRRSGKYLKKKAPAHWHMPLWTVPVSFFLVELYAYAFLSTGTEETVNLWPLAFGLLWAVMLTGLTRLLPRLAGRIAYGICYFGAVIYAGVQTGYFLLFRELMWLSDFRYASEGSDYFSILLDYPLGWWLSLLGLIALGVCLLWKYPERKADWWRMALAGAAAVAAIVGAVLLPQAVFLHDQQVQYARSDYGRAQSAQAAYENMFNAHRLYQVCGVYQTFIKDLYTNILYPMTPGYAGAQAIARAEIDAYFVQRKEQGDNDLTGIFEGKNVVLVLMESMDDWAIGEHTPTICRLMDEGINFENFYTPGYGGVRTFNSEFCVNTGTFLSSAGGFAFDYVTNDFRQSLASQLTELGYSALVYHYNSPSFYSRGVFEPAFGYEAYISYQDYVDESTKRELYDDQFLFNNAALSDSFFREGQKLNFIITRSAHLSYKYNEVLSYWGLEKYPEYKGMTGNEEEDCMYLKARLVDDLFARLLEELEAHGELENTVIVAFTDHYTYGIDDQQLVLDRSGVEDTLLVEKTPCFIWSADCPDLDVEKTLNTADLLPTVLNLMGVDSPYSYMGQDAFDDTYPGYALFPDGSWITQGTAYNAKTGNVTYLTQDAPYFTPELQEEMADILNAFVQINNLILDTDYYREDE